MPTSITQPLLLPITIALTIAFPGRPLAVLLQMPMVSTPPVSATLILQAYYRRFGFDPALASGFTSPYAGPHLMASSLTRALPGLSGKIDYAPAFAALEQMRRGARRHRYSLRIAGAFFGRSHMLQGQKRSAESIRSALHVMRLSTMRVPTAIRARCIAGAISPPRRERDEEDEPE